ncbi:gamma-secretase subunit Aph-1 [Parasteatoda tepidariorum]|uniref:Gamma-secretase subunit Aph-1 n=1 Tax=Parasteatoda tepidariorum TaxID=114398 RepID=A0A2L2YS01_PARTP|nr:gamma-secretase subunit Aph-1 [Parasteatoda tepidariorum]
MTVMEFFGCAMIAFGPCAAMLAITIARDPIRIIILISAAFFWLLSLLLSSILWNVVTPLKRNLSFGLVFSVIFQETFRLFFYKLLRKAEVGLKKVQEVGADGAVVSSNRSTLAYVAGLGFGLMSGLFSLINVLADSVGPGTVGLNGDSHYFFITSAFTTLAFTLLHTFWGVIFFHALDNNSYLKIAFVCLSHLIVSSLTLLNPLRLYLVSIIPAYVITIVSAILAYQSAGGSWQSLMTSLSARNNN